MANLKNWARGGGNGGGDDSLTRLRRPAPAQPAQQQTIVQVHAPPANPQPLIVPGQHYGAPPRPVMVQVPLYTQGPVHPVHMIDPQPETCTVVKPDAAHDPWREFMASVPDIAKANGIDYSNGVDAMQLAGRPPGAEMAKWTAGARYYNGVTDQTAAGHLDGYVRQAHREDLGSIRASQGTPRGSGPTGF